MWNIDFSESFDEWYQAQNAPLRTSIMKMIRVLQVEGPRLKRPYADTVSGSNYANMKELRIQHGGDPYRAFFAFDPERKGLILCAGSKCGDEKIFYKKMIRIADKIFEQHPEKEEEAR